MKNLVQKLILIMIILLGFQYNINAQNYQGITYQAEARDSDGRLLKNTQLDVKISILRDHLNGSSVLEETHKIYSNNYGMFVLIIGEGRSVKGYNFENIEWGKTPHFLNVKVKKGEASQWLDMGTEKFSSVPYAIHAKTAGQLTFDAGKDLKGDKDGVPSNVWSTFGNLKTNPEKDKLGTTDNTDMVFVTNNEERLRITADGQLITADGVGLELGGNLSVHGDRTDIDKDLYVGRNVHLNVNDEFDPRGETFNWGNFTVQNMSPTLLTGALTVDKETDLNGDLNVNNSSPTFLSGDLTVMGDANFKSNTNISGDLMVEGTAELKNLEIKNDVADGGFVAMFENTNEGDGDGIAIKLGKRSANNGLPDMEEKIRGLLPGFETNELMVELLDPCISLERKGELLIEILEIESVARAKDLLGMAIGTGNVIIAEINKGLKLPKNLIDPTKIYNGIEITAELSIPELWTPAVGFPAFPKMTFEGLGIEEINILDPEFWGLPDMCGFFEDRIPDPLDHDNQFITFMDSEDKMMGAIKAQSVADWVVDYLNPIFLLKLYGAFNSTMQDKKHSSYHFKGLITEGLSTYPNIGVEYTSGNGDYAEWLERVDPEEEISFGDIVAVRSGKITKELKDAEQIMAVSHKPIVLGNTPEPGNEYLGNNVAFMGQIPVKVMGAVSTGDYIVAKGDIVGYGIAVNPEDMTVDDLKMAVGRSWETNLSSGPKMVNTVVGVNKADYIDVLKSYEQRLKKSETRLDALEAKVNLMVGGITSGN